MLERRSRGVRTNVLEREIVVSVSATAAMSPGALWAVLSELPTHLAWGGEMQRRGRLLSLDAPGGQASVGTEFTSTGEDAVCHMSDRSVVTEATPERVLEFVTESAMVLKRGGKRAGWTIVHRYELEPWGPGCRITYTDRVTRASDLPGSLRIMRIPVLRRFPERESRSRGRRGLANLIEMAEERAGVGAGGREKR